MDKSQSTRKVLDARSLRGLAHPLRVRILTMLRLDGPATSTSVARRLGELTGTTSWHLRQLAAHGFIEEVAERGTKRERWWRAAVTGVYVDAAAFMEDAELSGATAVLLGELMSEQFQRAARFVSEDWSTEWRDAWVFASWDDLRLTPETLRRLKDDLVALANRYREGSDTECEAAERVILQIQGFPSRASVSTHDRAE